MSQFEPFSLLLPVYAGDRVEHLRTALSSAVHNQTLRPDEVVIVRDGPVGDDLAACLDELRATCPVPTTFVPLPRNGGLGPALDAGLRACRYDVVARMDADDIAVPTRFELQLPLMERADLVGAGLFEFADRTNEIVGRRVPPVGHREILRYARAHDPFNHPTVVYRRGAVLDAGGYGDLPLMEDYWLFARMLANGARAENLAEPLVYYRVGAAAYKRRGGVQLLRSELRLQRQFRDEGFTTAFQHSVNVGVRGGYRLIPWWARRGVYRAAVSAHSALRASRPAPEVAETQPATATSLTTRQATVPAVLLDLGQVA